MSPEKIEAVASITSLASTLQQFQDSILHFKLHFSKANPILWAQSLPGFRVINYTYYTDRVGCNSRFCMDICKEDCGCDWWCLLPVPGQVLPFRLSWYKFWLWNLQSPVVLLRRTKHSHSQDPKFQSAPSEWALLKKQLSWKQRPPLDISLKTDI